jgi:DNA polymerase-3 subunit beta
MKFSVSRDSLLKMLDPMNSVIEKRNSVPVLSNVKIELKDGKLKATATDNDLTLEGVIDATVEVEGTTTVNAAKLNEIVKKLSEGVALSAVVDMNADRMTITSGKARFNVACINAESFPPAQGISADCSFEVEAENFRKILTRSLFASSKDDSRQYLNGIYMHIAKGANDEDVLCFVATDGHRLAKSQMSMPVGANNMPGVILPRKAVDKLVAISRDVPAIKVEVADSKAQFIAGDLVLTTRLIDSTFPDYNRVIPQTNEIEMTVSKQALLQVVDRVAILSNEKSRAVKFDVEGGLLKVEAHNTDSEEAKEEIEVSYNGSSEVVIGFNAQYLSDLGKLIENEEIQFEFKEAGQAPVVLKDPKDVNSLYVLMPMRV